MQTRPDGAQARWQTPPGAAHSSVVQSRPETSKANVKGYGSEAKRSEGFDNDVFFNIEAKRTRSIVRKFILKRSEHVYIKEFKYLSEAK